MSTSHALALFNPTGADNPSDADIQPFLEYTFKPKQAGGSADVGEFPSPQGGPTDVNYVPANLGSAGLARFGPLLGQSECRDWSPSHPLTGVSTFNRGEVVWWYEVNPDISFASAHRHDSRLRRTADTALFARFARFARFPFNQVSQSQAWTPGESVSSRQFMRITRPPNTGD